MKKKLVLFLIVLTGSVAQAQRTTSPETLIRNATVLTITHGTLQNTDVLLRDGKIAATGKNLNASANARIIDGTGKYPGYNFYRVAGVGIGGKHKGDAENEAPPVDPRSLLP